MPTADYYPTRLTDLIPWHVTFALECDNYKGLFPGILSAPVVTQVAKNRDVVLVVVNAADEAKNYAAEVVAYRDIMLKAPAGTPLPAAPTEPAPIVIPAGAIPAIEAYTRDLVTRLKADGNYTEAIGQAMGIIGPSSPAGVPEVKATALTQSQVQLDLKKAGYAVLALDSRRGGGAWEQIAIATSTPYIDNRAPLVPDTPEVREYRTQGVQNNARVGPMSGIVSVVTVP